MVPSAGDLKRRVEFVALWPAPALTSFPKMVAGPVFGFESAGNKG
jgi:hypothetical protein